MLLTQMAIILLITVSCGWLALKVGQARVIGEIHRVFLDWIKRD